MSHIIVIPTITTTISKIRPIQWQKCIDAAIDKGLSRRTAVNIKSSITAFLAYADRQRWKTMELRKGDLRVDQAPPPPKKKILQPDAVEKRGKEYEAFYIHSWRFTVLTGMRRGVRCTAYNGQTSTKMW